MTLRLHTTYDQPDQKEHSPPVVSSPTVRVQKNQRMFGDLPMLKGIAYKSGETIWIVTDASDTGIGGMLGQGPDWKTGAPIAFESRTHRGAEKNYHTHDKELPGILHQKMVPPSLVHKFPHLHRSRLLEILNDSKVLVWKASPRPCQTVRVRL